MRAVKAGIGAAAGSSGPRRYQVAGRALKCPMCGHDHFARGEAQLHSMGMTFVGLEWAQKEATTLACAQCSRVEWFLDAPDEA
ncbi:MAG: DNA-binding protein [Gemmatimonadetes bacterium]|nr:DNA-binding protein [Gemmatimonadota bacterium]